jgi:hypothetical protein
VNPVAYFEGVPFMLQVPEFSLASPENPQVNQPNGMSIEGGFVRPAFHIKNVCASKLRLISVQGGVSWYFGLS